MLHRSLLKQFPLFGFCLQVSFCALTHAGRGGLSFRFACSVVLWGGRGAADKYHWPVLGALTVFQPHWVLSPSTLFRLQAALQGAGPALRGLPRRKPLRFRFSGIPQKHRLRWACVLCPPPSEQLRQPGGGGAHSPWVHGAFSPPRSQPQFLCTQVGCALCQSWGAGP